jgi:hypothetical protein
MPKGYCRPGFAACEQGRTCKEGRGLFKADLRTDPRFDLLNNQKSAKLGVPGAVVGIAPERLKCTNLSKLRSTYG